MAKFYRQFFVISVRNQTSKHKTSKLGFLGGDKNYINFSNSLRLPISILVKHNAQEY